MPACLRISQTRKKIFTTEAQRAQRKMSCYLKSKDNNITQHIKVSTQNIDFKGYKKDNSTNINAK